MVAMFRFARWDRAWPHFRLFADQGQRFQIRPRLLFLAQGSRNNQQVEKSTI